MTDSVVDCLAESDREGAADALDQLATAPPEDRQDTLQSLRSLAADRPDRLAPVADALAAFLDDGDRAVRLSAAKLFVALADSDPEVVVGVVAALADRLGDDTEFYYVRARSAEALGYVALEHPTEIATPDVLADLRVGLAFDEPEVREKLAKALECVALGDPDRLRHHVGNLTDRLDDDVELVRYHLCTSLAVLACVHPETAAEADDALVDRLDDSEHVRGRAAEALGALDRSDADVSVPREVLADLTDGPDFAARRAAFALGEGVDADPKPGSVVSIRATTEGAVAAITEPEADGECAHCGLELPETGPPMCPRCGAPQ
jgi:HEAT repeat protein